MNCTIADNFAEEYPGGFYTATFSYPGILNSIIYGNSSPTFPNIFISNDDSVNITYSDIEGGYTGEGNIDANPLFAYIAISPYQLTWTNWPIMDSTRSPCIDAGNPNPAYFDPDSTINDIGAYYFDQRIVPINDLQIFVVGDSVVLTWSPVISAENYRIYASDSPYILGDLIAELPETSSSIAFPGAVLDLKKFYCVICSN